MKINTLIFRESLLRVEFNLVIATDNNTNYEKLKFIREINWEAYRLRNDSSLEKFFGDILDMEFCNPRLTKIQKDVIRTIKETYEQMLNETSYQAA